MRTLILTAAVTAFGLFAASAAYAADPDPVRAAEQAAPTVSCHAVLLQGREWCFVKYLFPDGRVVSTAVFIEDGKPDSATKLLEGR